MSMITFDQLFDLNNTLCENGSTFRFVRKDEAGVALESVTQSYQGALRPYSGNGTSVEVYYEDGTYMVSYFHSNDGESKVELCPSWDDVLRLIFRYF